ncbi:MAG: hypothetical protein J0M18_02195 [Ignavibacteria bacterium]|nr:hypothetical protein [Ignavibacteria bacterium]
MADFIPRKDSDFLVWMDNFVFRLEFNYTKFGFTEDDYKNMINNLEDFRYIVKLGEFYKYKSKEITKFKFSVRNGKQAKLTLSITPYMPEFIVPKTISTGIETKFRNYVKRIKAHPEYDLNTGKDLRIILN